MTKILNFKWTVSKARETEGYNICTLLVNGEKAASCKGVGYDMKGTCLAEYLCKAYQPQLLAIKDQAYHKVEDIKIEATEKSSLHWTDKRTTNEQGLYGMTLSVYNDGRDPSMYIVGACGVNSVERIAKAAGIELQSVKVAKNDWGYIING
jgi:hypothetical protein